jgi:hypothetical protein
MIENIFINEQETVDSYLEMSEKKPLNELLTLLYDRDGEKCSWNASSVDSAPLFVKIGQNFFNK